VTEGRGKIKKNVTQNGAAAAAEQRGSDKGQRNGFATATTSWRRRRGTEDRSAAGPHVSGRLQTATGGDAGDTVALERSPGRPHRPTGLRPAELTD